MHKNPSKQRFIAASSRCTTKQTSSTITKCLSLIFDAHKIYCDRIKSYTGFNFMWVIQNSMEVHEKLQITANNLATYDFSTLYTSIPHQKLKNELNFIVTKAFTGMNKRFIKVSKVQATWSNMKKRSDAVYINCESLIKMIDWLIDNTYVTIGDQTFKQIIGIPMGTDCAPFLANLFLYSFEFKFMNGLLKQKDYKLLHRFSRCCRYIDDLLAINNNGLLKEYADKIYPSELKLTSEDKSDQEVNYLDLKIEIKNKKFINSLFDKRDHFNFPIVNYPNLDGNIPTSQSYGVFTSQLIRYSRGCMMFEDFKQRTKILGEKLMKQHFKFHKLKRCFNRFISTHRYLIQKYGRALDFKEIMDFKGYC